MYLYSQNLKLAQVDLVSEVIPARMKKKTKKKKQSKAKITYHFWIEVETCT